MRHNDQTRYDLAAIERLDLHIYDLHFRIKKHLTFTNFQNTSFNNMVRKIVQVYYCYR